MSNLRLSISRLRGFYERPGVGALTLPRWSRGRRSKSTIVLRFGRFCQTAAAFLALGAGTPLWLFGPLATRQSRLAHAIGRTFEQLGFTYRKLGQFLATRHDLISPALTSELSRFFEDLPPMSFAVVREIVEAELGAPLGALFAEMEGAPMAAATVAQVHRATSCSGEALAVKVQRPGIEPIFEADVANLRMLARLADAAGLMGSLALAEIVDEFARFTRCEFDFVQEAAAAIRLRSEAADGVLIPRIIPERTTRRVLTMTFMEGISLARILSLESGGEHAAVRSLLPSFDRRLVIERLTHASLRQFFACGYFHGDPHPGNVLVRPDNGVVLLDFGICGDLGERGRYLLGRYAERLALGDAPASFEHLQHIYFPGRLSDRTAFRRDAVAALQRWYEASRDPAGPMAARHLGGSFDAMVGVVRRHGYATTMDFILFWRAIIMLDSVALRLDPQFDLTAEMRRFFQGLSREPEVATTLAGLARAGEARRAALRCMAGAKGRAPPAVGQREKRWSARTVRDRVLRIGYAAASAGALFQAGMVPRLQAQAALAAAGATLAIMAIAPFRLVRGRS